MNKKTDGLVVSLVFAATAALASYCAVYYPSECHHGGVAYGQAEPDCSNVKPQIWSTSASMDGCAQGPEGYEYCDSQAVGNCDYEITVIRGYPCPGFTMPVHEEYPTSLPAGASCPAG